LHDEEKTDFPETFPGHIPFGKLFSQFIVNNNRNGDQPIEWRSKNGEPYGWLFYIERLGGMSKKYINPEVNLRENGVKENSVIIVDRAIREITRKQPKQIENC
jgi:hypothetical protein